MTKSKFALAIRRLASTLLLVPALLMGLAATATPALASGSCYTAGATPTCPHSLAGVSNWDQGDGVGACAGEDTSGNYVKVVQTVLYEANIFTSTSSIDGFVGTQTSNGITTWQSREQSTDPTLGVDGCAGYYTLYWMQHGYDKIKEPDGSIVTANHMTYIGSTSGGDKWKYSQPKYASRYAYYYNDFNFDWWINAVPIFGSTGTCFTSWQGSCILNG